MVKKETQDEIETRVNAEEAGGISAEEVRAECVRARACVCKCVQVRLRDHAG